MGKDKVAEEIIKTTTSNNITELILKYAPLVIGLVALVVCYLLYKKFQTLTASGDSVTKLEKQFTGFVKEQSDVNTINSKKFNSFGSQLNQLGYIIQNSAPREQNSTNSQMSPEREIAQQQPVQQQPVQQQPVQREFMPTSVIQTNFPIKHEQQSDNIFKPQSTTNKTEIVNDKNLFQQKETQKKNTKKVVTLTEDVLIEEASSDDE
jgi:hypothetical protein